MRAVIKSKVYYSSFLSLGMKEVKEKILLGIGIFFIFLGILAVANTVIEDNPQKILWMSYLTLFLLGVSCLMKSSRLLSSQLSIITLPYFFWDIDFFYRLKTGRPLWGLTEYFFQGQTTLGDVISLQHLYTLPLAYLAFFLMKPTVRGVWKISLAQIALVYVFSRLFTPLELNINCVFRPCPDLHLPFHHEVVWFLVFAILIFIMQAIVHGLALIKETWND